MDSKLTALKADREQKLFTWRAENLITRQELVEYGKSEHIRSVQNVIDNLVEGKISVKFLSVDALLNIKLQCELFILSQGRECWVSVRDKSLQSLLNLENSTDQLREAIIDLKGFKADFNPNEMSIWNIKGVDETKVDVAGEEPVDETKVDVAGREGVDETKVDVTGDERVDETKVDVAVEEGVDETKVDVAVEGGVDEKMDGGVKESEDGKASNGAQETEDA